MGHLVEIMTCEVSSLYLLRALRGVQSQVTQHYSSLAQFFKTNWGFITKLFTNFRFSEYFGAQFIIPFKQFISVVLKPVACLFSVGVLHLLKTLRIALTSPPNLFD